MRASPYIVPMIGLCLTTAGVLTYSIAEQSEKPTSPLADLVAKVRPSIVLIRTGGTRVDYHRLPEGKHREPEAAGTGFIVSGDGHIVTNNHVVLPHLEWPDPKISVALFDGRVVPATLLGRDELSDVAVVKIDAANLRPLRFANADELRIGQDVAAVGFALSYELEGMPSVTKGVISALDRNRSEQRGAGSISLAGLIQTDAAVNHGNSGGPLLNWSGEVVGINTLTELRSQGIHFAVSGRVAEPCVQMLLEHGKVHRASLGVETVTLSGRVAEWESRAGFSLSEGAFVEGVAPGSPAQDAGLKLYDVIEQIGPYPVRSQGDLNNALVWLKSGEQVRLAFRRYPAEKFDPTGHSSFARLEGDRQFADVRLK